MNRRTVVAGGAALAAAAGAATRVSTRAWAQGGDKSDVIVIGAGLSGLNATLLLEELGFKVTLLEGKNRVGGRLYTLDDVPGAPEGGGSGIGSSYGRLLDAMDRYGVEREPARPRTEPVEGMTMLNIRGQSIRLEDWPTHDMNPFPEDDRQKRPWQFQFGIFANYNPLSDPVAFTEPQYAPYDVSVYDFLTEKGFSHRAIELGSGTNMSYGTSAHELSVLMWFNIIAFAGMNTGDSLPGAPFAGKGGNQRVPEGMARGVKTDIRFNTKVVGIRSEADQAQVVTENGETLSASRVIVTSPFSALRLIDFDAPVSPGQSEAIRALGYTPVTHLHFVPKKKFWEQDGLPPSMWTDGPTARFMALRNNPEKPEEITSFIAFANDRTANHLDRLGPEAASAYVLQYLERIRPSTKDALEFVKYWSWQLDPFAGGAYAAWKPGQISGFAADMAKPAGRIHFAGEHTARAARGMEGAMESGERAAFEVADVI